MKNRMNGTAKIIMFSIATISAVSSFYYNSERESFAVGTTSGDTILYTYRVQSITGIKYTFYTNGRYVKYYGSCIPGGAQTKTGRFIEDGNRLFTIWRGDSLDKPVVRRSTLYRIEWDTLNLLLSESELSEFCNFVNGVRLSETLYRIAPNSMYLPFFNSNGITMLDRVAIPPGVPDLPSPWDHYLLDRPISGRVTTIDHSSYRLTLDVGSSNRVYPGCEFFGLFSLSGYQSWESVSVYPESTIIKPMDQLRLLEDGRSLKRRAEEAGASWLVKSYDQSIVGIELRLDSIFNRVVFGMEFNSIPRY